MVTCMESYCCKLVQAGNWSVFVWQTAFIWLSLGTFKSNDILLWYLFANQNHVVPVAILPHERGYGMCFSLLCIVQTVDCSSSFGCDLARYL